MSSKELNKFGEEFEVTRAESLILDGVLDTFNKTINRKEKILLYRKYLKDNNTSIEIESRNYYISKTKVILNAALNKYINDGSTSVEIVDSRELNNIIIKVASSKIDSLSTITYSINDLLENKYNFDLVAEKLNRYKEEELNVIYEKIPDVNILFFKIYVRSYTALLIKELGYPENIMYEISGETSITSVQLRNLEKKIGNLDRYKKTIIQGYYRDRETYKSLGEKLGVSGQRVRQIKCNIEASWKQRRNLHKILGVTQKIVTIDSTVEELDLSVRAYNLL